MRLGTIVFILACATLQAQAPDSVDGPIRTLVNAGPNDRFDRLGDVWDAMVAGRVTPPTQDRVTIELDRAAAAILARRRADVRNGATSGAAASTSAVLNPLLPAAFGFAMESGSVMRTISGNTATVSINPAGILCAAGSGVASVSLRESGCFDQWRKLGITLSFDNSRGAAPGGSGIKPLGDQFTQAGVRYEMINQRQPSDPAFRRAVEAWKEQAEALAEVTNRLQVLLNPLRLDLERRLLAALDSPEFAVLSSADLKARALQAIVDDVYVRIPTESTLYGDVASSWQDTIRASNAIYNRFAHGTALTAEYTLQRPDVATEAVGTVIPANTRPPSLHTARVILARGLVDYNIDLTVNLSSSWFEEKRPGMDGYWRDIQFATNATIRLRDFQDFGAPVLTMAGLWMYLHQRPLGIEIPPVSDVNINQPGHIGLFQTKLEIPTANAALRIPLSFTYSNRTDLIKESDVRGQIGISLNLDAFFTQPTQ